MLIVRRMPKKRRRRQGISNADDGERTRGMKEREREVERRDEKADWRGWILQEDEMAGKGRADIVSGCESFITEREL